MSEGQNTGGGPTKGGENTSAKSPGDASAQSGGSRSKEAKETGSSPTGGNVGGGKNDTGKAEPKISGASESMAQSIEQQAEVEQHNKEFAKGHDRAPPAAADKVNPKFWKGG